MSRMENSNIFSQKAHITLPRVLRNSCAASPRSFAKFRTLGNYRRQLFNKSYSDQASLEEEKLKLLYEIGNLRLEIRQCSHDYIGVKDEYDTNQLESTKIIAKEEGDMAGQIATEQYKYSREINDLESEIEELSTQVEFFKSLFSQESESKINEDFDFQKEALNYIREQISLIDSDKELIAADINSEEMHKKVEETANVKNLMTQYRQELKMLKREEKQLKLDLKNAQNNDPEVKAKEEFTKLSEQLKVLEYKKSRLLREKDDMDGKINIQNTLLQSVLQKNAKSQRTKTSKTVAVIQSEGDSQLFEMTHAKTVDEENDCEICGKLHFDKEKIV